MDVLSCKEATGNPMLLHDSDIKLEYLGLLFFTRMLKIINKLFFNINFNFNCCSVNVNFRVSAEEKFALTGTRSDDLLNLGLLKLRPYQLSYIIWPYKLLNMGF